MSKGIFIGSFDPWHNGHEDRLKEALQIFEEVYIVVADNDGKKYWFDQSERTKLVEKSVKRLEKNVVVISAGNKMIHDICHDLQIFNVYRGVKAGRTLDEEIRLQVATKFMAKKEYNEEILFVYGITSEEDFRGSSIVKLLAKNGKDISLYVPVEIIGDILEKAKECL